jgi:hypothetical protein
VLRGGRGRGQENGEVGPWLMSILLPVQRGDIGRRLKKILRNSFKTRPTRITVLQIITAMRGPVRIASIINAPRPFGVNI